MTESLVSQDIISSHFCWLK